MQKKIFLFGLFVALMIFNLSCMTQIPDYVHNVKYVRRSSNSNYGVIYWNSFENADEYVIYRKNNDKVIEFARTSDCVYGYKSDESFWINSNYSYAVQAIVNGEKTFCSNFVELSGDEYYE